MYISSVCFKKQMCLCCVFPYQNLDSGFHTVPHKKKLWDSLELSNTLIVENVTLAHSGVFTCTASSGQMEKSASAYLTVFGGCTGNIML